MSFTEGKVNKKVEQLGALCLVVLVLCGLTNQSLGLNVRCFYFDTVDEQHWDSVPDVCVGNIF